MRSTRIRPLSVIRCLSASLGLALPLAGPAGALVYTYENTSSGAIPVAGSNTACRDTAGSHLERTFTVSESFNVANVAIGINVSHLERGDVRAFLIAPDNTVLAVAIQDAGDVNDDYDVLISSNTDSTGAPATTALNDNDLDPIGDPPYHRLVTLGTIDTTFAGKAANGTWRLRLCDRDNNSVNGTFNRARLVLSDAATVPQVCTGTVGYEWGDNGNGVAFTSANFSGVAMSLTSATDLTGDAVAGNFTTQTDQFGAETGYFVTWFDAEPADLEVIDFDMAFAFSPAVRDLAFTMLDIDTGNWEDYVRIAAFDSTGARVPYAVTLGTAHQRAGDVIEADSGNIANTSAAGNATYRFAREVSSLAIEYWAGDDLADPQAQRVGIGNPTLCAFDYGDAPSTYGTVLGTGARHVLGRRNLWLGANPPDGEADGAPGSAATTDDTTQIGGVDDEDGVASFPAYAAPSSTYTVTVNSTNNSGATAYLVGYIDWNRDGDFADAGERSGTVTVSNNTEATNHAVTWTAVPANAGGTTATYARFRLSTNQAAVESPLGQAPDGEIEDYPIPAGTLPVTLARLETSRSRDGWRLEFATADETLNAGFRVWGVAADGGRKLLASLPAAATSAFEPARYAATLTGGGFVAIELEDVGLTGENRVHGPFALGAAFGAEPRREAIDWQEVRSGGAISDVERMAAARAGTEVDRVAEAVGGRAATSGRLLVDRPGIYRVTYEQLAAAGIDLAGVPSAQIALLDGGRPTARYIEPSGLFGPGGFVEFLAAPKLSLASPVDVLELRVAARSALAPSRLPGSPGLASAGVTAAVMRVAPDRAYSFGSPNGDPWYDERLLAWGRPAATTRSFDLPDLAAGPVTLTLDLWGGADDPQVSPDHHVVVRLNGVEIASERFDGIASWRRTLDVSGLVQESGNQLEVGLPFDNGSWFDLVHLEGFEVAYSRATRALDGSFRGRTREKPAYAVDGWEAPAVVAWLTGESPSRGVLPVVGGAAIVPTGQREAVVAAPSALLSPAIRAGIPAAKRRTSAEYVVITHPALAAGLGPLLAVLDRRGLDVDVVTVDEIYAAGSDHAASPEAVHDFLANSFREGRLRFALLVGADSIDPHDHLGQGSISFVPTAYRALSEVVRFTPSDDALADVDGDGLPELAIGRLPVRTAAEIATMADKLAAWQSGLGRPREALLVAGASDAEGQLSGINGSYAARLAGWSAQRAEVDALGTAAVRQATLAAFGEGRPLVSFVGHSSPSQWDFTPVLSSGDLTTLAGGGPTLVAQWGCWSSYHVDPSYHAISAELLRTPGAGAALAIGATALTSETSHRTLGAYFYEEIGRGARTVGEALLAAKRRLGSQPGAQDAILGVGLLGDPAAPLPPLPASE